MKATRDLAGVSVRAPAKINLFFEILAKRSDGFHEVETLMAPVDLVDDLRLEVDPSGALSLDCHWAASCGSQTDLGELPPAEHNLALRAVTLLKERAGVSLGARLTLTKRIPSAAGLGGGSADAAAALMAANVAWQLGWSREQLAEVAAELGSDIPFFLYGSSAICRGRGERIEPVSGLGSWHAVVAKPPEGLSTAAVYAASRATPEPCSAEGAVAAMRRGDARLLKHVIKNRLESAAGSLSDWIGVFRRELERLDCTAGQMSGSGSSYFGICRSALHARRVAAQLRATTGVRVFVVRVGA